MFEFAGVFFCPPKNISRFNYLFVSKEKVPYASKLQERKRKDFTTKKRVKMCFVQFFVYCKLRYSGGEIHFERSMEQKAIGLAILMHIVFLI